MDYITNRLPRVTCKQAVLMKKLGFPQDSDKVYIHDGAEIAHVNFAERYLKSKDFPSAPYLDEVVQYLRDEKRLFISVNPYKRSDEEKISSYECVILKESGETVLYNNGYSEHYVALSVAVDFALEFLKLNNSVPPFVVNDEFFDL